MKTFKPYLSLSKNAEKYELGVIVAASKNHTIIAIDQEEILRDNNPCWGVILTLSEKTQLVNGPENPVFSTTVDIALEKSDNYRKILCCTRIASSEGQFGPSEEDDSAINFEDGD